MAYGVKIIKKLLVAHSKLSLVQITFQVGTSHPIGFVYINSRVPSEQYSVLW